MPEAGKGSGHEHSRPMSTWSAYAVPGLIPQEDGLELLYVRSEVFHRGSFVGTYDPQMVMLFGVPFSA